MELHFILGIVLIIVACILFYSQVLMLRAELKDHNDRIQVLNTHDQLIMKGVNELLSDTAAPVVVQKPLAADLTSLKPAPAAISISEADENAEDDDMVETLIMHGGMGRRNAGVIEGVEDDEEDEHERVDVIHEIKTDMIPEHLDVKPQFEGTPADVDDTLKAMGDKADSKPEETRVDIERTGKCAAIITSGKKQGHVCNKKCIKSKVYCREHADVEKQEKPQTVEIGFSDGTRTDPILLDGGIEVTNPIIPAHVFNKMG